MTEEEEIAWAKLSGIWEDAEYRRELVRMGKCLRELAHDENIPVRHAARTALLAKLMGPIKHRNENK